MKFRLGYILLTALLIGCRTHYTKQGENFTHYPFNTVSESNKVTDSVIAPYHNTLSAEMNRVLANSSKSLGKEKYPGSLGNFVCDAMMFSAQTEFAGKKVDIALVNNGGLRATLPAGDITVGNIFELMPFENKLVLLKISGEKLLLGFKTIVAKKHPYYGAQLVLKNDSLVQCLINNKAIETSKSYYIITSDYLANGGDNFVFLAEPLERLDGELRLRDAILNYCETFGKNNKQLIPYTDERLVKSK